MVDTPDIDKFDDTQINWTAINVVTPSPMKDVEADKLKVLCDHERRLRRIEAFKKVLLAVIASIPIIIAMLR